MPSSKIPGRGRAAPYVPPVAPGRAPGPGPAAIRSWIEKAAFVALCVLGCVAGLLLARWQHGPIGPYVPPAPATVRGLASSMSADWLGSYAARVREAAGRVRSGEMDGQTAAARLAEDWKRDRLEAEARTVGPLLPAPPAGEEEGSPRHLELYAAYLEQLAAGFDDASALVKGGNR